jgi:hypothetical protein
VSVQAIEEEVAAIAEAENVVETGAETRMKLTIDGDQEAIFIAVVDGLAPDLDLLTVIGTIVHMVAAAAIETIVRMTKSESVINSETEIGIEDVAETAVAVAQVQERLVARVLNSTKMNVTVELFLFSSLLHASEPRN